MNAIQRRLRRLEDRAKPTVSKCGETLADVIRSRRRRRLEEAGFSCEARPREFFGGARTRGEIMRLARQRARGERHAGR